MLAEGAPAADGAHPAEPQTPLPAAARPGPGRPGWAGRPRPNSGPCRRSTRTGATSTPSPWTDCRTAELLDEAPRHPSSTARPPDLPPPASRLGRGPSSRHSADNDVSRCAIAARPRCVRGSAPELGQRGEDAEHESTVVVSICAPWPASTRRPTPDHEHVVLPQGAQAAVESRPVVADAGGEIVGRG